MKIPYVYLILFISCISCKEEKKITHIETPTKLIDSITKVIIRPITEDFFDNENDTLKYYYSIFNNHEIWYDSENRSELISEIKNCYFEGLNPNDYAYDIIEKYESKRTQLDDKNVIEYDILLTKSYLKLAKHLYEGKLNPKDVYNDWDLLKKEFNLKDSLQKAISEKKVTSVFNNLKPKDIMYQKIKHSLLLLHLYPEDNFEKIYIEKKIEPYDSIETIVHVKKRLQYWKDYFKKDSIFSNIYDKYTQEAVKNFQKRHGLKPDAIIGQATIKALNYSRNERIQQTIANLERWKWYPNSLGDEYLIINLPDYSLQYVKKLDTISTHTIVVGKPSRKTPILTSKITNLVVNPTWTVPPTIIKEDLTPAALKNRNYFLRNNMTIYDKAGKEITPEVWNPELSRTYRYVQSPSKNNSLGLVKFNFMNRHSVYLHDTNHRDYFSREYKALSSGCVRIENPIELSNTILKGENKAWKDENLDSILISKKTKILPIKQKIFVHLFYWTSWSENNKLIFREDIYDLDMKLAKALGN